MPTAVLCDDEPLMREALKEHLQRLWPELQIIGEAAHGAQGLQQIQSLRPDVAFLDIRMPGLSGLQVAQLLPVDVKIVFVTAYDEYALQAFDANAVDYILKPIDVIRLGRLVQKLRRFVEAPGDNSAPITQQILDQAQPPQAGPLEWLQVAVGQQIRMVHIDDVQYFESDNKYTRVVAEDCDGLIRLSLKELLSSINPGRFLQIHRSAVVNRRFVRGVHRRGELMELEIKGRSERLRVSESNQPLFRAM